VTAPHSHRQVRCRPHEQAIDPTSVCPGRSQCPRGQRRGGLTVHWPVDTPDGQKKSTFEHGTLTWKPGDAEATVTYS
jgi:hypothetical protein